MPYNLNLKFLKSPCLYEYTLRKTPIQKDTLKKKLEKGRSHFNKIEGCWHSRITLCKVSSQHNLIKSPQKAQNPAFLNQVQGARFVFSKKASSLLQSVMDRKEELLRFLKLLNRERDYYLVFIKKSMLISFATIVSQQRKDIQTDSPMFLYIVLCVMY